VQILCLTPYDPVDYQLSFSRTDSCAWTCIVGNLKKWKDEPLQLEFSAGNKKYILTAERINLQKGYAIVRFFWNGNFSFGEILDFLGVIPIPPYLNRNSETIDKDRYQTVYSIVKGSVAAPTAGLHFTQNVLNKLRKKNLTPEEITLHVAAGTFQPVKTNNVSDHIMHNEVFSVTIQSLKKLSKSDRTVIATGTTTLRTLESLYWLGVKSIMNQELCFKLEQWDCKSLPGNYSCQTVFENLIKMLEKEKLVSLEGETGIMIIPGYNFKVADALITNFHQPCSTLLLLVAAFIGDDWSRVYQYALEHNFRFLSYGDSSILWKKKSAEIPNT
jgi:S-adenosylmethionine:tRNA ribosyltransferase-isomerase